MIRFFIALATTLTAALMGGCSSVPYMPLADNTKVDTTKPLYLMTTTVKNDYRQWWQPRVLNVTLAGEAGSAKPENMVFRMDEKGTVNATQDGAPPTYLVRFTTDGGLVTIEGMGAIASTFPINGFYFIPVHASLSKSTPGIYYLGALRATIRERKDGEFRAGPVVPLIDQAVAGASGGTFDIEIIDAYDADVTMFKKTFPLLNDLPITKSLLAPWSREKAQTAWEKN